MQEKAFQGSEDSEFHWTTEGIRRDSGPPRPRSVVSPPSSAEPDPPGSENRRFPRIDLKLPILYKILAEEPTVASVAAPPHLPTKTDNISPSGACLVLAERLDRGTVLALSIHLTDRGTISAVGRVVWSPPTETAHHFLIGLEFIVVYQKTRAKTEYLNANILKEILDP